MPKKNDNQVTMRPAAFPLTLTDPAALLGNPLRGLKPTRAASLLEGADRGDWTTVQWLMRYVERLDPDMLAIKERRQAALGQLGWTIRIKQEKAERLGEENLAEDQKGILLDDYENVDNLMEAVEFLETAVFRGFAHVSEQNASDIGSANSAIRNPQSAIVLEPLDQHWWLRDGIYGDWALNHDLTLRAPFGGKIPEDRRVNPRGKNPWIIHEVENSVLWIAILKYMRANQSQKWWDAFCECFARRGTIIIAPPSVGEDRYTAFRVDAENVARGGSGALPNGSIVTGTNAIAGAGMPFKEHMAFLRECLILAGTGGLLTMLATGGGISGGAPAQEHGDAFKTLARRDAARISELLRRRRDRRILEAKFPGRPILAYFELDTEEPETVAQIAETAGLFNNAGFDLDADELSERSGYTLTTRPPPKYPDAWGEFAAPRAPGEGQRPLSQKTDRALPNSAKRHPRILQNGSKTPSGRAFGTGSRGSLIPNRAAKGVVSRQNDLSGLEQAAQQTVTPVYAAMFAPLLEKIAAADSATAALALAKDWQPSPVDRNAFAEAMQQSLFPAAMMGFEPVRREIKANAVDGGFPPPAPPGKGLRPGPMANRASATGVQPLANAQNKNGSAGPLAKGSGETPSGVSPASLAPGVAYGPLPFEEARKFWARKRLVADFADLETIDVTWDQARVLGFKVAGITEDTVLRQIYEDLDRAVKGEVPVAKLAKELEAKYGLGSKHAETVVRTNLQSAYAWGNYQQLTAPGVAEAFPYWGFDVVKDDATSDICSPLWKHAYLITDPIWSELYPPNHFNCRTTVVPLTAAEANNGWWIVTGAWPHDPDTGVAFHAAHGFEGNIGAVALGDVIQEAA